LYSDMIARNADRIAKLTDDLLSSTKPSELEIVPACMNDIIMEAIEACRDRINLLHIDLKCQFPEEPIHGRWDPEKLKIAFTNIMINAIEAMENTPNPELKINLAGEQNHPIIKIGDNGKGMDEATLTKIFDPFFSNRNGGMGLGMTATHNIISMHDGKINVSSYPGRGTEFEIVL
jgi:signal transduction histidine kinase